MSMPEFTMRQLLEAGVHFGHHTRRWNPKMRPFIFGVRNGVHILDLQQTVPMLDQALQAVREVAANRGRILFVGTKRQAQDKVKESAKRCGQILRQPPLVGWHADELENNFRYDRTPERTRQHPYSREAGLYQKRNPDDETRAREA